MKKQWPVTTPETWRQQDKTLIPLLPSILLGWLECSSLHAKGGSHKYPASLLSLPLLFWDPAITLSRNTVTLINISLISSVEIKTVLVLSYYMKQLTIFSFWPMSKFNLLEEKTNIKNMLSYLDLRNTHTDTYTSKHNSKNI